MPMIYPFSVPGAANPTHPPGQSHGAVVAKDEALYDDLSAAVVFGTR